jgi:hypothetical protein
VLQSLMPQRHRGVSARYAPVSYGDMSRRGGGKAPGHDGHKNGNEIDVRPIRNDQSGAGTNWRSSAYDRDATREFINTVRDRHPNAVIFFNDPQLIKEGLTQRYDKHDDHLHLRW